MFNFLCGTVVESSCGLVVLQCNDIGYEFNVSSQTQSKCIVGAKIQLYAYLQVREDGIALFGFATKEEKAMFLRLISVSGIGCKMAQAILSGISYKDLAMAIYNADTKSLVKIKGLGKKTAERLVLELKEKVTIDTDQPYQPVVENNTPTVNLTEDMNNAVTILMSLGLNRQDATQRVVKASEQGAVTTEELINTAFRG